MTGIIVTAAILLVFVILAWLLFRPGQIGYSCNVVPIQTPMSGRLGEATTEKDPVVSPEDWIKAARKNGTWCKMAFSGQVVWIAPDMIKAVTFRDR